MKAFLIKRPDKDREMTFFYASEKEAWEHWPQAESIRETFYDVEKEGISNLSCKDCKLCGKGCKRINPEIGFLFAKPWFVCTTGRSEGRIICRDFVPDSWHKETIYEFEQLGFDKMFELWIKDWLPYQKTDILVGFTVNNDTSVRYYVPFWDFVNGTMVEDGKLHATKRTFYRRVKPCDEHPTGYILESEYLNEPIPLT